MRVFKRTDARGSDLTDLGDVVTEATIEITSRVGLQGSGSARLALAASQFESDILLVCNARQANAKNVMDVMALPVRAGTEIKIKAVGPDQGAAAKTLAALLG
ncbi:HPr family phosphocarrier protein [Ralstonia sp. R-29]|uniref:HPr family phosphocarrier protein n=1 Tax=Ralstonia sp. R-29 TaxID=3404059 RepID=UPI003CF1D88C